MTITGWNQGDPQYGIGAEALARLWIDRERAMRAAGMLAAANQLRLLRREMQEALNLVAPPEQQPAPAAKPGQLKK